MGRENHKRRSCIVVIKGVETDVWNHKAGENMERNNYINNKSGKIS